MLLIALAHTLASVVPIGLLGLTVGFTMGRGVPPWTAARRRWRRR